MKRKIFAIVLIALCALAVCVPTVREAPAPVAAANIVKGDTVANVKKVQTRLKELGYYKLGVDGIFGSGTRTAVRKFQKDYGLTVDGIVGANTERALGITLSGGSSGGSLSSSDAYLLAKCVYAEARGEPYTGQVAVAAVVLNRVRSSKFPNSVSGVIYQPYAFTCVADGQINLSPNQSAINAARDAMNGWDPTYGCLYYYNPAKTSNKWIWSRPVMLTIGQHRFCK